MSLPRLAPAVFLPALIFETGMGALAPVLALSGRALGASVGAAGLVLALLGVGQILGDVPAGALAARLGDRKAMLVAAGVAAVTLCGCALARSVWQLAAGGHRHRGDQRRLHPGPAVLPDRGRARGAAGPGAVHARRHVPGGRVRRAVPRRRGAAGRPVRDIYWLALLCTAVTAVVVLLVPDVADPVTRPGRRQEARAGARRCCATTAGSS